MGSTTFRVDKNETICLVLTQTKINTRKVGGEIEGRARGRRNTYREEQSGEEWRESRRKRRTEGINVGAIKRAQWGFGLSAGLAGASVRLETPARTERWLPPLFAFQASPRRGATHRSERKR